MIIVLKPHPSPETIRHVLERIEDLGFVPHLSQGVARTIIGVIGDEDKLRVEPLQAIDGVEHSRDVALLHQSADGDRHCRRRNAHVIGEVAEHRRRFAVEVIEDAHLARADVLAGDVVADVPPVAGEVDAGVVAEDGGDVGVQVHDMKV